MDAAFASYFEGGRRVLREVDADRSLPLVAGEANPRENTYCQRILDGRLPEIVPDTSANPEAAALAATNELRVGAHIGVPIRLSNGTVYGTICCFSHAARPDLDERDLAILRAFAEIAARQVERETETGAAGEQQRRTIEAMIAGGRVRAVYQPVVRLADGMIVGAEALARFAATPDRGPEFWFAAAHEAGVGTALELSALRAAAAALPVIPPDSFLAVNLSPAAAHASDVIDMLGGLPIERIVLEVTERDAVACYERLRAALAPLRAAGMRVAIDDVGAGYASMQHILALAPDIIKLDMSLTRSLDSDPVRRALATAFVAFARETGAEVLAEGVETEAERNALSAIGVERGQGYLFARPQPLEALPKLFRAGRIPLTHSSRFAGASATSLSAAGSAQPA